MTDRKTIAWLSLILFLTFALYFRTIILVPGINSDLNAHIRFAKSAYEGQGVWPRHIMYFALVALTSFWSRALSVWQTSGWIWLSVFVVAKFLATIWFGNLWLSMQRLPAPRTEFGAGNAQRAIVLISLCMTVVFCFAQPAAFARALWYGYSFPPNTWHNSTQIALAPFAIVLFGLSVRQFERPDRVSGVVAIICAASLSALAKPSFLMAWLPAYGICSLIVWARVRSFLSFALVVSPVIAATVILASQYYLIYATAINNTSVDFGYLAAWTSRERTELHFYISIFFSSLFPIVFYTLNPKRLTDLSHVFSILVVLIAYFYSAAFSEIGDTQSGNFLWPIISANFVAYMLCAFDTYAIWRADRAASDSRVPLRLAVPAIVFGLSSLWGVAYIIRFPLIGEYR